MKKRKRTGLQHQTSSTFDTYVTSPSKGRWDLPNTVSEGGVW